jgi:hypothetical protein
VAFPSILLYGHFNPCGADGIVAGITAPGRSDEPAPGKPFAITAEIYCAPLTAFNVTVDISAPTVEVILLDIENPIAVKLLIVPLLVFGIHDMDNVLLLTKLLTLVGGAGGPDIYFNICLVFKIIRNVSQGNAYPVWHTYLIKTIMPSMSIGYREVLKLSTPLSEGCT